MVTKYFFLFLRVSARVNFTYKVNFFPRNCKHLGEGREMQNEQVSKNSFLDISQSCPLK